MNTLLAKALANKHTTGAAAAYFLAKVLMPILSVWLPDHKAQLDQTAQILEGGAVAYGFLMAGDAGKSASKADLADLGQKTADAVKTGDTSTLSKPPTP